MKKTIIIILAAFMVFVSCKTGGETDAKEAVQQEKVGFHGSYLAGLNAGSKESPEVLVIVGFYTNHTCYVSFSMRKDGELLRDKLENLTYKINGDQVLICEGDKVRFEGKALSPDLQEDPDINLQRYIGLEMLLTWKESTGAMWEKYSEMYDWPMSVVLEEEPQICD